MKELKGMVTPDLSGLTVEELVDAIKNKLPRDKVPLLRKAYVKEYLRRLHGNFPLN